MLTYALEDSGPPFLLLICWLEHDEGYRSGMWGLARTMKCPEDGRKR